MSWSDIVSSLTSALGSGSGVVDSVSGVTSSVSSTVSEIPGEVSSALGSLPSALGSLPNALGGIPSAFGSIPNALAGVPSGIISAFDQNSSPSSSATTTTTATMPTPNFSSIPQALYVYPSSHSISIGGGKPIVRGRMQSSDPSVSVTSLEFFANPNTITVSYQSDSSLLNQNQLGPAANIGTAQTNSLVTYSFDLLFDRTYELWHDPTGDGVLNDVKILEQMIGVSATTPLIQYLPVDIYFGGSIAGSLTFNLHGVVTTMQVVYEHFNFSMAPIRCIVSLVVNQIASAITAPQVKK